MVEVNCQYCGKEFSVQPHKLKVGRGKHCSVECQRLASRRRETRSCPICSTTFTVRPSEKKIRCSKKCASISLQKREIRACIICDREFEVRPASKKRMCSPKCVGVYISRLPKSENTIKREKVITRMRKRREMIRTGVKECRDCGEIKSLEDFPTASNGSPFSYCYKCMNVRERSWDKKNRGKTNERKRRRRLNKRNAKGSHSLEEFRKLYDDFGGICVLCSESIPFYDITRDHILPIYKGGSDYIWNIQPACVVCNSKKHIKVLDNRPFIPSWVSDLHESYRKKNRK